MLNANHQTSASFVQVIVTFADATTFTASIPIIVTKDGLKGDTGEPGVDGEDGADGLDGAAGTNAKTVSLTAANYVITYDAAGNTPSPSGNLLLTATQQNFVTPRYRFTIDGVAGT